MSRGASRLANRVANPMREPVREPVRSPRVTLRAATLPPAARDHESDGVGAMR